MAERITETNVSKQGVDYLLLASVVPLLSVD
jgi:hypothetical protein